jgi:hypothetical protein
MAVGICEKNWLVFQKKNIDFQQNRTVTVFFSEVWKLNFLTKIETLGKPEKPIGFQFFVSKFHKLNFTLIFNRFYWFLKNQSRPILHPNRFFNACSNPIMNLNKKTTEMNRSLKIKGKCSKHQHFPSPTLVPLRDGAWRQTSGTCRVAATPEVEGHHPPRLWRQSLDWDGGHVACSGAGGKDQWLCGAYARRHLTLLVLL